MPFTLEDLDNLNQRIDALMAAKLEMEHSIRFAGDLTVTGRGRIEANVRAHLVNESAIPRPEPPE